MLIAAGRRRAFLSEQEVTARWIVFRHWWRHAFSNLELIDGLDAWCHADNRAIDAQDARIKGGK
jgi:hypothetical protein